MAFFSLFRWNTCIVETCVSYKNYDPLNTECLPPGKWHVSEFCYNHIIETRESLTNRLLRIIGKRLHHTKGQIDTLCGQKNWNEMSKWRGRYSIVDKIDKHSFDLNFQMKRDMAPFFIYRHNILFPYKMDNYFFYACHNSKITAPKIRWCDHIGSISV